MSRKKGVGCNAFVVGPHVERLLWTVVPSHQLGVLRGLLAERIKYCAFGHLQQDLVARKTSRFDERPVLHSIKIELIVNIFGNQAVHAPYFKRYLCFRLTQPRSKNLHKGSPSFSLWV